MSIQERKETYVAVVKIPPPPKPPSFDTIRLMMQNALVGLTNRAAMSISMLVENPHAAVPSAAKNTAS